MCSACLLTIASVNPRKLYHKTGHTYIHARMHAHARTHAHTHARTHAHTHTHTHIYIAYSTVDTQPPPHNYVPHAKAFGNKWKNSGL